MVEEVEHSIPTKYPIRYAQTIASDCQVQSPTLGLYVAEPLGTNRRIDKKRETGAFKPVLWVG